MAKAPITVPVSIEVEGLEDLRKAVAMMNEIATAKPEIIGKCGACNCLLYLGDRACPQCGAPAGESVEPEHAPQLDWDEASSISGWTMCYSTNAW